MLTYKEMQMRQAIPLYTILNFSALVRVDQRCRDLQIFSASLAVSIPDLLCGFHSVTL